MNSTPSQRQLRVGEELRHALAAIFERGDIRDPDVAGRGITVTAVSISPDLHQATAYVVPLGGGDAETLVAGLKRVSSYLKRELARKVRLRTVPELTFAKDVSFDNANRIETILRSPEVAKDLGADEDLEG